MAVANDAENAWALFGVRPNTGGAFMQYAGLSHLRVEQGGGGLGTIRALSYGVGEYEEETIMLNEDGSASFAGDVTVDGALRINPQGDLTMGVYTNQP